MSNFSRAGLSPMTDYYTVDYEPDRLIEEWSSLRQQLDDTRRPSSRTPQGKFGKSGSYKENSRYPRSSIALNNLYDMRRRSVKQSTNPNSDDPDTEEGSEEDGSSSTGSTYRRHHRYDEFSTAYQTLSDPYDRAQEVERQEKFIEESKRLARPFVPSNRGGLEKPTRLLIGDCVRSLYKSIAYDWPEAEVMVVTTAEDLIAVYFSLYNLKKRQVSLVLRYMNRALKCNPSIHEYQLSKVSEGWDVLTDDSHVLYTLRPPWVKKRVFLPNTITPPSAHVTN
ncbi:hypothetical protein ADEAN_000531200 [Angomonas deanei]|uniref:Uncharacterized protein n=1 Tax=Angomonas deanei TaxID=59799 RepID=A0A7G2CEA2_9TRYP|nr:hypothetical protein ADEAN_000531200 [Angomonas deanei]